MSPTCVPVTKIEWESPSYVVSALEIASPEISSVETVNAIAPESLDEFTSEETIRHPMYQVPAASEAVLMDTSDNCTESPGFIPAWEKVVISVSAAEITESFER